MKVSYRIRRLLLALFLPVIVASASALAQPAKDEFSRRSARRART